MKRTVKYIFIFFYIILICRDVFAADCGHGIFTIGSGTDNDPWEVNNLQQFKHIEQHLYNHYRQTATIDANGITEWNCISGSFQGTYSGGNFEITNIKSKTSGDRGLFEAVGGDGIVKNLKVTNSSFYCISSNFSIGSITSANYGTISNCQASDIEFNGYGRTVGGIIGDNLGTAINCINYSNSIRSSYTLGGVVATNHKTGTVRLCYNYGNLTLGTTDTGGVVGVSYGLVIECANFGSVRGGIASGGILGINVANSNGVGSLQNCYNAGKILYGGAIVGTNMYRSSNPDDNAKIKNTYDVAQLIYGSGSVSKIAGNDNGNSTNITNSYIGTDSAYMGSQSFLDQLNETSSPKVWKLGDPTYPYPVFVGDVYIELASNKIIIGDNTYPLFSLNHSTNPSFITRIRELTTNMVIYQGALINQISVNLDTYEGDMYFVCDLLDKNDGILLNSSNIVSVNKTNILNRLHELASEKNSSSKIVILNDSNRIIDDNSTNRALVEKIKQTGQGIYVVGTNVSDVLSPLWIP